VSLECRDALLGCRVALQGCRGVLQGCRGVLHGCRGVLQGYWGVLQGYWGVLQGYWVVLQGCCSDARSFFWEPSDWIAGRSLRHGYWILKSGRRRSDHHHPFEP
jgi:hypothetical protein